MSLAAGSPARAQIRFVLLPANDGYGLSECLEGDTACGMAVAEAWCAANGLGKAIAFGKAGATDVTGSLPETSGAAKDSFIVQCDE